MMVTEKEPETAGEDEVSGDELSILRKENEALAQELKSRNTAYIKLEQTLASKDREIDSLKEALAELERKLAETSEALARAVDAYKAQVIQINPGVLAELITGETVEEVDESLKNALALVERVRQEMEAETSKTRIPAGAPQRAPLDLSGLSPREKIKYAIGGSS
jgi:septal ring factor EnvC (AmiA/AmiB activator)